MDISTYHLSSFINHYIYTIIVVSNETKIWKWLPISEECNNWNPDDFLKSLILRRYLQSMATKNSLHQRIHKIPIKPDSTTNSSEILITFFRHVPVYIPWISARSQRCVILFSDEGDYGVTTWIVTCFPKSNINI